MSPRTHSPHRFRSPAHRQPSPARQSRKVADEDKERHQDSTLYNAPPTQSQFAPTPRFGTGKARAERHESTRSPSVPVATTVQALRGSTQRAERIDEFASFGNDDDQMIATEQTVNTATTGERMQPSHGNDEWTTHLPLSPKRRRLNERAEEPIILPSVAASGMPQTKAGANDATPRFVRPQMSTAAEMESDTRGYARPAFLRPAPSPQESRDPLPEVFSPHRRGHKFVSGGMASTAQRWIIEAGQVAMQSRRVLGYEPREEFVLRVRIEKLHGSGPSTALGKRVDGAEVYVLFANQNGAAYGQHAAVAVGALIGIRAPTWDIELAGRLWTVAVDWKSLS